MRPVISLILVIVVGAAGNGPQGPENIAERLAAMRALADGVTVETAYLGGHQKLERLAEPIYRFDDPARRFSDGTVWAWGRSGRPAAAVDPGKRTLARGRHPLAHRADLAGARAARRGRPRGRRMAAIKGGRRHAEAPWRRGPG